jgi:anaerobic magnesium-protoporphyrin IX monomethyl ester cyclase
MRITLLHPAHTSIGSRIPKENLPPYGLLCIGGPLLDAGHDVTLVNADLGPLPDHETLQQVIASAPDAILIGHSGSTSAHPTVVLLANMLRAALPKVNIIYGGVWPTYHWQDILSDAPAIDVIVRGEGEATAVALMAALEADQNLARVNGIAYRRDGTPHATAPAPMIKDLSAYRIGWELISFASHGYWGGKRSVIMQFSRGCPHLCTYCGQRGFWTKWRHRDPLKFAAEIAWLYRTHGVELINLADENPTTSPKAWRAFLEALIAEDVPVQIVGSTRADDIVRDRDILHLYKKAGCIRFLMGLEGTDEATLTTIKKGGSRAKDRQAIQLLRQHGIIGLCTFAIGFEEETDRDYWRLRRHLLRYDPDQVMSIFATPHRWTPFFDDVKNRRIIDDDQRNWDYKHQVMEVPAVPAWRVFLWVKFIEISLQARPKALYRTFLHPDPDMRHAMQWYTRMGRRVVIHELRDWFSKRRRPGITVAEFLGAKRLPEQALARSNILLADQHPPEAFRQISATSP